MAHEVICLGKCSMNIWEAWVLCCWLGKQSMNADWVLLVGSSVEFFYVLPCFMSSLKLAEIFHWGSQLLPVLTMWPPSLDPRKFPSLSLQTLPFQMPQHLFLWTGFSNPAPRIVTFLRDPVFHAICFLLWPHDRMHITLIIHYGDSAITLDSNSGNSPQKWTHRVK